MKIAILTSGILPVPAVQGGAVENLMDFYLAYNDQHQLHDITVYSVAHEQTRQHPALQSAVNHYHYINVNSLMAKVRKRLYKLTKPEGYYHYTIEYFLDQCLRHMASQHYDLVILENRPAYALKVRAVTAAPIVLHLHNDFLNAQTKQGREIYDSLQRVVTVSRYIGQQVKTLEPDGTKCLTVNNGIDLAAFSPKQNISGPSRQSLGLKDDDFVMVFSGRITAQKGILPLVQAMKGLKDYANIKLLIIGSPFYGNATDNDEFLIQLKEEARELKDSVVFTGFQPYDKMPGYLRLADCAVVPSQWDDPFPTSVLEAMAAGKPIITTRRGGIPEMANAFNAVLLPTDQHFVSKLTAAILDLYGNEEKRRLMGRMSKMVAGRFSKERYAERFFQQITL